MQEQIFYHADRLLMLEQHQALAANQAGYSNMGEVYAQAIRQKNLPNMSREELREYHAETVRNSPTFQARPSRLKCFFAANTVAEAVWFGTSIQPKPNHKIPIYEVFATKFLTLDMAWLDYECEANQFMRYCQHYWYGEISNHAPATGPRKTPRLEVLISMPARIGRIVGYA